MAGFVFTCQQCGIKFVSAQSKPRKFCSRKCVDASPGLSLKKICPTCGCEFETYPSHDRTFCTLKCTKYEANNKTHGETKTRLHRIWGLMKSRCHCSTNDNFHYYGGRGICVCDEWRKSYESFRDWANTNGYAADLEIDRIDVNGNYEPSNCRWATRTQQMCNTRKRASTSSQFKGVVWSKQASKWIARISLGGKQKHLGTFENQADAAMAYDEAAKKIFGEFASVNFA